MGQSINFKGIFSLEDQKIISNLSDDFTAKGANLREVDLGDVDFTNDGENEQERIDGTIEATGEMFADLLREWQRVGFDNKK